MYCVRAVDTLRCARTGPELAYFGPVQAGYGMFIGKLPCANFHIVSQMIFPIMLDVSILSELPCIREKIYVNTLVPMALFMSRNDFFCE